MIQVRNAVAGMALIGLTVLVLGCSPASAALVTVTPPHPSPTASLHAPPTASLPLSRATASPAATTENHGPGAQAKLTIDLDRGDVTSNAFQVTAKGEGYPAGAKIKLHLAAERPGAPAAAPPVPVREAVAGQDGAFQTSFVLPSGNPLFANATTIQVWAYTEDGTVSAVAYFTNTGAPR